MKKFVWLFMSAMALSLAISCNKDDEKKLVGGEDVTDSFLNPGGKLMDGNVNTVGAWSIVNDHNEMIYQFFIVNSNGQVYDYSTSGPHGPYHEYLLDNKGILHCSNKDFFYSGVYETKFTSMFDFVYTSTKKSYEELNESGNEGGWAVEKRNDKFYLSKFNEVLLEVTLTNQDVDTFVIRNFDYENNEEDFEFIRRIKGFSE